MPASQPTLKELTLRSAILGTLLSFVLGFLVAAACGYMAGLVGSSASPISDIDIISIIVVSLMGIGQSQDLLAEAANIQFFTALAIFCTSILVAVAAISSDNLQDLKTGWLVTRLRGANRWP